ncbi:MAG TPA: hypothetical protein DEB30_02065 [Candidatus Peribacter riflensis]|uniref:DnaK suppressor protein n=1 Tax=Candidatus Peribacter riflensis TaxID=1735162 RepID=A0A0S1SJH1_9BACT|nr:MAG: DnaK suppressor protein [Candidatus Peribacter riflensis]OGJ78103.1 MAG: hypothetical protein A2412_03340 [Candidatus Peribacteria bacterium RIFOXYC1_FULL_58_8]OGJ79362.1 MAG: hypothetical protein A2398_04290 [Candidatus Peribacteria bacterium RIFOXYB1_FULL_57_12]ALM10664.1 MAG: TraR/DksA family transcriptional regulator [Candidatus Peribacter riflensis]ALM11766.1 MAG: DnaK suppressor protein [Candidatus Peribacter riflensis]
MAKRSLSSPSERTFSLPQRRGKNWPATQQELEAKLVEHSERLIRGARSGLSAAATAGGELCDAAQTEEVVQDQATTLESLLASIARIQAARQRMRDGVYGICEGCDSAIPVTRLEAVPDTTLCINCAQERERNGIHRVLEPSFVSLARYEGVEQE